jgi:hypothetical protein
MEESAMRTRLLGVCLAATALLLFAACSVNVKKDNNGEDKNVDISTPFGGIHVNNNADVRDTGLPVYPGARVKPENGDHDEKSANVELSAGDYGLKVVAVEYLTDDAPAKVVAYYQDQLKKYGHVLQCHNSHGTSYNYNNDSDELKCDGDDNGKTTELKAGTKGNQRIVAVNPEDKGSDFALVYVHMRGKGDSI